MWGFLTLKQPWLSVSLLATSNIAFALARKRCIPCYVAFLPKHAFLFQAKEPRTKIVKGVMEEGKDMGLTA